MKAKTYLTTTLMFIILLDLTDYSRAQHRTNKNAPEDSVKTNGLKAPIKYEANDSIVFSNTGYAHLYGNGKVNYEKMELTAQIITMNVDSSTLYAHGTKEIGRAHV